VGLLGAMANLPIDVVLEGHRLFEEFKGVMAEQIICQLLLSNGHSAHYWSPEAGKSEVDFVIQKDMRIVPIEVKSGENLRSRSLRVYFDKYQPQECIRTPLAGYQKQDWVKTSQCICLSDGSIGNLCYDDLSQLLVWIFDNLGYLLLILLLFHESGIEQ
jgi:Holliday junction resolvase-like predicted endonuclease